MVIQTQEMMMISLMMYHFRGDGKWKMQSAYTNH